LLDHQNKPISNPKIDPGSPETSWRASSAALLLQQSCFLFGGRPSAADFAILEQLTCLALFDPTPAAVTLEESARVYAWVEAAEALSGLASDKRAVVNALLDGTGCKVLFSWPLRQRRSRLSVEVENPIRCPA
jgi:hypothetical protein